MDDGTEPIRLTTHNARADEVNSRKMAALKGDPYSFIAQVDGDFPEHAYPAEEELQLKPGAQVMFIRNDSDGNYYNGKLGRVEKISNGVVTVTDQEGRSMDVTPVEWPNAQYELDEESGEICQNVVGTFRQIPLRVAWAITIHKSQGLTFDNVIIDAGAAFAFGQVYVALSRCRSLEGIVMESPVRASIIYGDEHVAAFNASATDPETVTGALDAEEKGYAYGKYREVFEFGSMCSSFRYLLKLWNGVLQDTYPSEYNRLQESYKALYEASKVADTFRQQISAIERKNLASGIDDNSYLHERLLKSAGYFLPLVKDVREVCMMAAGLEIDNKETKKKVKEVMDELLTGLDILFYSLEAFQAECFDIERLCRVRTQCVLADRKHETAKRRLRKIEHEEGGVVNEELRERLQQWRMERFKKDNVPAYTIMHQSTLLQIATLIPTSRKELLAIKGFGEASYKKYGEEILVMCSEFSNNL
jgi:hypothetical protein